MTAGRSFKLRFEGCPDLADSDVRDRLLGLLRLHPQVRDVRPTWNAPNLELDLSVVGRVDAMAGEVGRMVKEAGGKTGVRIAAESPAEVRFVAP